MLTQVEAEVGVDGTVVLLKPLRLKKRSRAIVTILNDNNDPTEPETPAKRDGLREMFGSVSLGAPTGLDNETIDGDLAGSMSERISNSEPPGWHREYLEEREKALAEGSDSFISMDEFGADLCKVLSS